MLLRCGHFEMQLHNIRTLQVQLKQQLNSLSDSKDNVTVTLQVKAKGIFCGNPL